ncbi:hypothetical protein EDC01DRAFT_745797 [Geopyxis carbonaria]|nr:hypothetical protein EDC01DRAFT_745797 [Geopyxis carbonaria]
MASPTYTLRITFHSARNLPIADLPSFSSDPYIISTLRFPSCQGYKLHHRTPTLPHTLEPKWEHVWSIANVPASGATVKVKVMDEDSGDHDDALGVARIETGVLSGPATEYHCEGLRMRTGRGTWIALVRLITVGCGQGKWSGLGGDVQLTINIEQNPPTTEKDEWTLDRPYTIGPNLWTQHFSPLIGIITHTTSAANSTASTPHADGSVQHYSFAATKIQLTGPLPPELYHQYVAFRPIIKTFYTKSGISGHILNRALKHQYRTIYSYDKSTSCGTVELAEHGMAKQFLNLTHWGKGGRVYTYVITLDAEWRFTETGKEFGIQMLSKHTMHSCVSIHVGFAGEFFVRAIPEHKHLEGDVQGYELVIDNDSGTYRPPKEHLPMLQKFLQKNLDGLRVTVKEAFDNDHQKSKKAHAQEKERSGRRRFKQPSSSRSSSADSNGSISSSDEQELRGGRLGIGRRVKKKAWEVVQHEHESNKSNEKDKKGKAVTSDQISPAAGASN